MSPLISRILHNILADFNEAVGWKVSMNPLIFDYSNIISKLFLGGEGGGLSKTPSTIRITVTYIFQVSLTL